MQINESIQIVQATENHINLLAPLYHHYRSGFHQDTNVNDVKNFLTKTIDLPNTAVVIAVKNVSAKKQIALGFINMFCFYSTISFKKMWIINDIFVEETQRQQGIGKVLIRAAKDFALADGATHLLLETTPDNKAALALYASEGYVKDETGIRLYLELKPAK